MDRGIDSSRNGIFQCSFWYGRSLLLDAVTRFVERFDISDRWHNIEDISMLLLFYCCWNDRKGVRGEYFPFFFSFSFSPRPVKVFVLFLYMAMMIRPSGDITNDSSSLFYRYRIVIAHERVHTHTYFSLNSRIFLFSLLYLDALLYFFLTWLKYNKIKSS